jgi:hypothetical protein
MKHCCGREREKGEKDLKRKCKNEERNTNYELMGLN